MASQAQVEHCRRIARLGGLALFAKYGREYMRQLGKKGLQGLVNNRFGGDYEAAKQWLVTESLRALDPVPENGAWADYRR